MFVEQPQHMVHCMVRVQPLCARLWLSMLASALQVLQHDAGRFGDGVVGPVRGVRASAGALSSAGTKSSTSHLFHTSLVGAVAMRYRWSLGCMLLHAVIAKVRHLQLVWVPSLCCGLWVQASAQWPTCKTSALRSLQLMQIVHMGSAAQQLVNHQAIRAVFSAVFALTKRVIRDSKHFNLTYAAGSVRLASQVSCRGQGRSRHGSGSIIGVTWLFD
jgi:hypothetical protein